MNDDIYLIPCMGLATFRLTHPTRGIFMDIWATYCRQTVACSWCGDPIELGTMMHRGINKRKVNGKVFTTVRYWHLFDRNNSCYTLQSLYHMESVDYKPRESSGGRPSMHLIGDDWKKRQKYLRIMREAHKMVATTLVLGQYREGVVVDIYRDQIADARVQLEDIGGVPKKMRDW